MKLTFTAQTKPACEGTVSRHIHSHVKQSAYFIPVVWVFNSLWSSGLSNWILRGGHICLLSLAQLSIWSQEFVWMKM